MKIIRDNEEKEIVTVYEDKENPTILRHFKGKNYRIITIAKNVDDNKDYVVYQALYGDNLFWIRDYDEFFSKTDKKKYPNVKQEYRFEII